MGILDGIVEWIAEQIMYGLDMINTSVLGALGCDMNTFLRYFPAAETMYTVKYRTRRQHGLCLESPGSCQPKIRCPIFF